MSGYTRNDFVILVFSIINYKKTKHLNFEAYNN